MTTESLVQDIDWAAIAPPLAVAAAALVVLLTDLFTVKKQLLGWITFGGLGAALLLLIPLTGEERATFCSVDRLFCSYETGELTLVLQGVLLGAAMITVLLSMSSDGSAKEPAGEFNFLLLASVTGAVTLVAARDLLTLVVALETTTLPAYALVGIRRTGKSAEAALKFFLMSVAATAVLLFGVSLLYGASGGVVHLEQLAKALDGADPKFDSLARAGVVLTLAGLAFKVAAVPFHFWVPDTYRGAPVPVAAFLSVVSKTAGFGALILVAGIALKPYAHVWGPAFAVLAALTMTVGNLVALRQTDAVRLLAWSSVAQSGYVLVPFGAQGDLQETLPSAVAYLAVYAVMNLGAFAVVVLVGGKNVEDYRALARSRPGAAIALGFFLLGLAGLPPGLMGLFAKVTVFQAVVGAGTGWLAVVMAVNVVIALYYYLVWTAVLFGPVKHSRPALPQTPGQLALGTRTSVPVTFAVGALVALGAMLSVAPQLVLRVLSVPGLIR